jgi:hypothetical protein
MIALLTRLANDKACMEMLAGVSFALFVLAGFLHLTGAAIYEAVLFLLAMWRLHVIEEVSP